MIKIDEFYMNLALKEAKKAYKKNEVPVGCVLVYNDKVIAKAHNLRENKQSALAHAEMLAVSRANKKLKSWRLEGVTAYVTLEPCSMCASAFMQARIKRIVYGASDEKSGALGGKFNLYNETFNHTISVSCGILKEASKDLLQSFFKKLRT